MRSSSNRMQERNNFVRKPIHTYFRDVARR